MSVSSLSSASKSNACESDASANQPVNSLFSGASGVHAVAFEPFARVSSFRTLLPWYHVTVIVSSPPAGGVVGSSVGLHATKAVNVSASTRTHTTVVKNFFIVFSPF